MLLLYDKSYSTLQPQEDGYPKVTWDFTHGKEKAKRDNFQFDDPCKLREQLLPKWTLDPIPMPPLPMLLLPPELVQPPDTELRDLNWQICMDLYFFSG